MDDTVDPSSSAAVDNNLTGKNFESEIFEGTEKRDERRDTKNTRIMKKAAIKHQRN